MSKQYGFVGKGGGVGPILLLDGSSSTDESEAARLPAPMSNFALQVVAASTDVIVLLQGAVASSSDAIKTTLITFAKSSDATGDTLFTTGKPVSQVSATLTAGGSSGGASAWVTATP